jgi:hypothetical protein
MPGQPLPALPRVAATASEPLRGLLAKAWAFTSRASPQAESPTSEESNQDFHMPHHQQGRTPASTLRAATRGSPSADPYATPLPAGAAARPAQPALLLGKQLSKMDVACAHDTIGVVFAAEAVQVSGLLRPGAQQLALVLKDALGASHECRLAASKNGRFCYLSGLGAFLAGQGAQPGDGLSVQLASSGRLVVAVAAGAPQPGAQPRAQAWAAVQAEQAVQRRPPPPPPLQQQPGLQLVATL